MTDVIQRQQQSHQTELKNEHKMERTNSEMSIGDDTVGAIHIPVEKPHLLRHSWALWYDTPIATNRRSSHSTWASNLKKVVTIHSVEDFWGQV